MEGFKKTEQGSAQLGNDHVNITHVAYPSPVYKWEWMCTAL